MRRFGVEKGFFGAAVARCVEKRRHAALRGGAPAAVRQAAAVDADAFGAAARAFTGLDEIRRRADACACVDIGAAPEQQRDDRGMRFAYRKH